MSNKRQDTDQHLKTSVVYSQKKFHQFVWWSDSKLLPGILIRCITWTKKLLNFYLFEASRKLKRIKYILLKVRKSNQNKIRERRRTRKKTKIFVATFCGDSKKISRKFHHDIISYIRSSHFKTKFVTFDDEKIGHREPQTSLAGLTTYIV